MRRALAPAMLPSFASGVLSRYASMPPALSMHRKACVVRLKRSQQPSFSLQRRLRCAFGLKVRLVFLWLKLMLLPKRMSLPA